MEQEKAPVPYKEAGFFDLVGEILLRIIKPPLALGYVLWGNYNQTIISVGIMSIMFFGFFAGKSLPASAPADPKQPLNEIPCIAETSAKLEKITTEINKARTVASKKEVVEESSDAQNYIDRFSPIAVAEMRKFGIPASITLAQGLLESSSGRSTLARKFNNHFGMKCFSRNCRKGHCSNHTDDSHKDFFRNYSSAWESYRAHSQLLKKPAYRRLFKYKRTDYRSWAHGLKACGYATDKAYAQKLIKTIETYGLQKFDR